MKAQLLKGREGRAASATPPVNVPGLGAKQPSAPGNPSSLRNSPNTPVTAAAEEFEQERNINELISQYSESKPATDTTVKQEVKNGAPNTSTLQQHPTHPDPPAKSQIPSLGSPTKVTKPAINSNLTVNTTSGKTSESGDNRNGSISEISEGEILEESTPKEALPPAESKESQNTSKKTNTDAQTTRKTRDEPALRPSYGQGSREESLPPRRPPPSNSKAQPSRTRDEKREEFDSRQERKTYHPSDYDNERGPYSGLDKQSYPRREFREQNEEYRRPYKNEQNQDESTRPIREAKPPTLAQLLPHDDNLREWLEITGYHNEQYRDKVLNRRRKIAALDAERNRLLAEMEAEEHAGFPIITGAHTPSSVMLAPPLPNTVGVRGDAAPKAGNAMPELQRDRIVSNKRPYSDVQDPRDDGGVGKIQRTDDRGPRDEDITSRHSRPSVYEPSRPLSPDYRDERDSSRPRYDDGRGRGRPSSRDRDLSPDSRGYDSRPRGRAYDRGSDDYDRDDWRDQQDREKRPFETRGAYRGRAFDPNFRGRGRGSRGRGDFQSHLDSRSDSSPFGSRIANGKPYKDVRGFERGGKGGQ